MTNELAKMSELETALANASDIQEVAKIRVKMGVLAKELAPRYVVPRFEAARGYLDACRKHGEFWLELDNKRPEGRPRNSNKSESYIDHTAAGFKYPMDAKRCAAVAQLDPQDLEEYFEECRRENRVPTLGGAYKVWQMLQPDEQPPDPEWIDSDLIVGDFREVDLPSDSVDLIFTDPPYDDDAVSLFEDLSARASDWLVPGGFCMAYSGQWTLPRVVKAMDKHLSYFWTGAILHSGDQSYMRKHHISVGWKPVLMFYKPPLEVVWGKMPDVVSGGQEKESHPWQQAVSEAEHFIKHACATGVVVDPMCGSGTTLLAAKRLGLRYVGMDVDRDAVEVARGRLNDA